MAAVIEPSRTPLAGTDEAQNKKRGPGYFFIERPIARVLEALRAENS